MHIDDTEMEEFKPRLGLAKTFRALERGEATSLTRTQLAEYLNSTPGGLPRDVKADMDAVVTGFFAEPAPGVSEPDRAAPLKTAWKEAAPKPIVKFIETKVDEPVAPGVKRRKNSAFEGAIRRKSFEAIVS